MNFSERENAIGSMLKVMVLPRYKRPEHMDPDTARAEIADMVADLNAAWPIQPAERFAATSEAFARAIRATYSGRTWPPIAVMLKALKAALEPAPAPREATGPASVFDMGEIRRDQLLRWCKGERSCPDHLITRENLEALAQDGLIQRSAIDDMLAFARGNHGISPEADMMRDRKTLPASLMVSGNDAGILSELDAMRERLRPTGIRNPAFAGAAE